MATNLQVNDVIGTNVQSVHDETGQSSALAISSAVVGIGTTAAGKALRLGAWWEAGDSV
jgi:hypothetical protein